MSGSRVTNQLVRPRTKCSNDSEESCAEQESNCLEEGEDAKTDEEGEGEAGTADWGVRAGPRNKPTARVRKEHEATHMPFRDWCAHCMMGRGRTHHHVSKQRSEKLFEETKNIYGLSFSQTKLHCELPDVSDMHCGEAGQTSEHHEQRCSEEGNRGTLGKSESDKIHQLVRIQRDHIEK